MGWFLYDIGLRHERVKSKTSLLCFRASYIIILLYINTITCIELLQDKQTKTTSLPPIISYYQNNT